MTSDFRGYISRLERHQALAVVTGLQASRRHRDQWGVFFVEGIRNLLAALDNRWHIEAILFSDRLLTSGIARSKVRALRRTGTVTVKLSPEEFRELSHARKASGVAAIVRQRNCELNDVNVQSDICLLAADSIESSGNLGTLLRTSAAVRGTLKGMAEVRHNPDGERMNVNDDAAKVRFFPPGIPILVIFVGYILNRFWPVSFGFEVGAPARYFLGGALAIGSIAILGFWAVLLFRRGGQNENPWKPTPHIESRGPFRFTRNPMYLQMVLVCIGVAFATANWWTLALAPVGAWALQQLAIKPEETYLEQKFGEAYLDYKRKVRRWF